MTDGRDSEFSSPFDALLDQNRKRLEQLYGGPDDDRHRPAATSAVSTAAPVRPARPAARAPSDPKAILDERFGARWRHEVVERRRDGADMAVRCRLTVAAEGIDVTRSGRARIEQTSVRPGDRRLGRRRPVLVPNR